MTPVITCCHPVGGKGRTKPEHIDSGTASFRALSVQSTTTEPAEPVHPAINTTDKIHEHLKDSCCNCWYSLLFFFNFFHCLCCFCCCCCFFGFGANWSWLPISLKIKVILLYSTSCPKFTWQTNPNPSNRAECQCPPRSALGFLVLLLILVFWNWPKRERRRRQVCRLTSGLCSNAKNNALVQERHLHSLRHETAVLYFSTKPAPTETNIHVLKKS